MGEILEVQRLRELFAKRDDPYAGVDLANASRIGGAIWWIGAIATAVLLPFAPPDDVGGATGWVFAGLVIAGAFAGGLRLRSLGAAISVNELLANSYAALASIAVLVWVSGGLDSPYPQLYVLSFLYTAAVHPPRRVLPYLGCLAVLFLAPLVYDRWDSTEALGMITELVMWLAVAFVAMFLMSVVRAQRLGLRREGEQARRQARVDPLTALLNRRAFDEVLGRTVDQARASGEPLSLLVCDLDGFKEINDRFGHLEGDRLLRAVAQSLRQTLRRPDIAYRWGGDEFALILPGADAAGAEQVAERIRAAVRVNTTPDGEPLRLATGVAELEPATTVGSESLLAAADHALLRAKGSDPFLEARAQG
ncbi:MAG: diguanylate cyclase domain-containing protein [Thermoleophilaceae bacterium]